MITHPSNPIPMTTTPGDPGTFRTPLRQAGAGSNSQAAPRTVTFVIVDDHPVVSFAMKHLLTSQPGWSVAAIAASPAEAMTIVEAQQPHVVLIDLMFPGSSGLEFVSWMHAHAPRAKSIVYSIQPKDIYARRCIRAGAHGYVGKESGVDVVLATIRQVLEGRTVVGGKALDENVRAFVQGGSANGVDLLSNRELEVLDLLGQGLSNRRIAKALCRTPKTIESHRYRISRKLKIRNGPELVHFAIQHRMAEAQSLPLDSTNAMLDAGNSGGQMPGTGIAPAA